MMDKFQANHLTLGIFEYENFPRETHGIIWNLIISP